MLTANAKLHRGILYRLNVNSLGEFCSTPFAQFPRPKIANIGDIRGGYLRGKKSSRTSAV